MKRFWWLAFLCILGCALLGASAAADTSIDQSGSDMSIEELQSLVTSDAAAAHGNRPVTKKVMLTGEYTGTVSQQVGKEVREATFHGTFNGKGTLRFYRTRVSGHLTGTGKGSYYDGTVITPWSGGGIGIIKGDTISGLCYGSATVKQDRKRLFTTGITNRETATITGNTITGTFEAKRGVNIFAQRQRYTVHIEGTYTITW